jgi:hypothetical protein
MSWNHRVVRKKYGSQLPDKEWLEIHEVYYDKDGNVEGMTVDAVAPGGNNLNELRSELQMMLECLEKPILDEE